MIHKCTACNLSENYMTHIENSRYELSDIYEDHHIVPKCIGGNDEQENRIYLSPRNHFIAHKILAEDNPDNPGLVYAYWRMCNGKTKVSTPEEYELGKRLYKLVGPPNKGKSPSEETREKLSKAMKGRVITQEHRNKIRNSLIGVPHTKERIEKISGKNHPMYGKKHSEETRKKMSENHADNSGINNPLYGKHLTEGHRNKISESLRGKKFINRQYNLICKRCSHNFIGSSPSQKYCSDCRGDFYE